MNWIINNERCPEKEGMYYTEDSVGTKNITRFRHGCWQSQTGHPVAKWLDEKNPSFNLNDLILVWAKAQEITIENTGYDVNAKALKLIIAI